jgi:hypothetical protein
MKCCTNCFHDKEIIGFILQNSTENNAVCPWCGSTDVSLVESMELEELFKPVVFLFKPIKDLSITVPVKKLLYQKIQENWNIFRVPDPRRGHALLCNIMSGLLSSTDPLLNEPVEIEAMFKPGAISDIHEKKWENFAEEIKFKNRFFLNETIDLTLLTDLLGFFSRTYDKGKIFYRGRVSNKNGFEITKMGKPPTDKATSGRANPNGIPYLYVSTNMETTIYESRSSYLDYITIATFLLLDKLKVVRLRGIGKTSPFVFSDQIEYYVTHLKYLDRLEKELSKPVRRFDKELDYLPSQYLCEYVKSLGYDAIEYGSSLKSDGINLAVFDDTKLEARSVEVYEITEVDLHYQHVAP